MRRTRTRDRSRQHDDNLHRNEFYFFFFLFRFVELIWSSSCPVVTHMCIFVVNCRHTLIVLSNARSDIRTESDFVIHCKAPPPNRVWFTGKFHSTIFGRFVSLRDIFKLCVFLYSLQLNFLYARQPKFSRAIDRASVNDIWRPTTFCNK